MEKEKNKYIHFIYASQACIEKQILLCVQEVLTHYIYCVSKK